MNKFLKTMIALSLSIVLVSSAFAFASAEVTFTETPQFMAWADADSGIAYVSSFEGESVDPSDYCISTVDPAWSGEDYGKDSMMVTNFWTDNMPYGFAKYNDTKYSEANIFTCSWSWPGKMSLGFTDDNPDVISGIRSRFMKATEGSTYKISCVIACETNYVGKDMTAQINLEFWDKDLNYLGEGTAYSIPYKNSLWYNGEASMSALAPAGTAYMTCLFSSPVGSTGKVFLLDSLYITDANCATGRGLALGNVSMPSEEDTTLQTEWLSAHPNWKTTKSGTGTVKKPTTSAVTGDYTTAAAITAIVSILGFAYFTTRRKNHSQI